MFKVGDLVRRVKTLSLGDDKDIKWLLDHSVSVDVGVVMETGCFPDWEWMGSSTCIKVFICGAVEKILLEDLEIV